MIRIGLVGCGHIGTVHSYAIKQLVDAYKGNRIDGDETFRQFVGRQTKEQLAGWLSVPEMADVK